MHRYFPVLAHGAKVFPLTVTGEALPVPVMAIIGGGIHIIGSGGAQKASLQTMLEFAAKHQIKPQIEKFPMTQAGITEAMQKLRDGKMRYRGVVEV